MFRLRITGDLGFEFWADIPGFEGLYQVSTYGRVKRLSRWAETGRGMHLLPEIIMKQKIDRYGYPAIALYQGKGYVYTTVHRLMGVTFLFNPSKLPMINHKDCIRHNNSIDNIEWCTAKYNSNYGNCPQKIAASLSKPVLKFDLEGNFICEYSSIKNAALSIRDYSIKTARGTIGECCLNHMKTAYGYVWKFKS